MTFNAVLTELRQEVIQLWAMREASDAKLKRYAEREVQLRKLLWQHGPREPVKTTFERIYTNDEYEHVRRFHFGACNQPRADDPTKRCATALYPDGACMNAANHKQ